jgi:hypothetical protein
MRIVTVVTRLSKDCLAMCRAVSLVQHAPFPLTVNLQICQTPGQEQKGKPFLVLFLPVHDLALRRKLPTYPKQNLLPNLHLAVFTVGERVLLIPISFKPSLPGSDQVRSVRPLPYMFFLPFCHDLRHPFTLHGLLNFAEWPIFVIRDLKPNIDSSTRIGNRQHMIWMVAHNRQFGNRPELELWPVLFSL